MHILAAYSRFFSVVYCAKAGNDAPVKMPANAVCKALPATNYRGVYSGLSISEPHRCNEILFANGDVLLENSEHAHGTAQARPYCSLMDV